MVCYMVWSDFHLFQLILYTMLDYAYTQIRQAWEYMSLVLYLYALDDIVLLLTYVVDDLSEECSRQTEFMGDDRREHSAGLTDPVSNLLSRSRLRPSVWLYRTKPKSTNQTHRIWDWECAHSCSTEMPPVSGHSSYSHCARSYWHQSDTKRTRHPSITSLESEDRRVNRKSYMLM